MEKRLVMSIEKILEKLADALFDEEEPFFFPAVDFEVETGISGISKAYVMPEGKTPEAIQDELIGYFNKSFCLSRMLSIGKELESLTPDVLDREFLKATEECTQLEQAIDASEEEEERFFEAHKKKHVIDALKELLHTSQGCSLKGLEAELQQIAVQVKHRTLQIFNQLLELNPELAALEVDIHNDRQIADIVNGAISYLNPADITRFSINAIQGEEAWSDPKWEARMIAIEKRTGVEPSWVPAPSTLTKIEQQLDRRETSQVLEGEALKEKVLDKIEEAWESTVPHRVRKENPDRCSFPAVEFEQETGVTGISQNYQFPYDADLAQLELELLRTDFMDRTITVFLEMAHAGYANSLEASRAYYAAKTQEEDQWGHVLCDTKTTGNKRKDARQKYQRIYDDCRAIELLVCCMEDYGAIPIEALEDIRQGIPSYKEEIKLLCEQLRELNPCLEIMPFEDMDFPQIDDMVWGVLSKFNLADIAIYIEGRSPHYDEYSVRRDRISALGERIGCTLQWVPAPSTLTKIEQQLDRREQKAPGR